MRYPIVVAILVASLLPVSVAAQTIAPVNVGARIRVRTAEVRNVTGRLDALTTDNLTFHPDGKTESLSVPVAALIRLDVSRGSLSRKSSAWKRAKWVAAIGAIAGAISLGLQHEEVDGGSSAAKAAALGAWSGGLFGGLIGGLVGAAHPPENWERVR